MTDEWQDIEMNPWGFRIPSGRDLRSIRNFLGLRLVDVEERTGIKSNTLSKWEREVSNPTSDSLRVVLDYYRNVYIRKIEE